MTSRILILMVAVLMLSCRPVTAPTPPPVHITDQWACRPDVLQAMKVAWAEAGAGVTGTEAGFRIDFYVERYKVRYIIVSHDFTNEQGKLTIDLNPFTVAEFHVHPNNSGAEPSTPENNFVGSEKFGDTKVADEHFVDIYTYNTRGLYVYRWQTRRTELLRKDLEWTNSCLTVPTQKK